MSDAAVKAICKTLIAIALLIAAVILVVTGHESWVLGLFILLMVLLT